jgi:hypothetical protein
MSTVSAELLCHRCGYDLRAHPPEGKCPECGVSVAESRRVALVPRRPAWRESDPPWRRRMLAGIWVLALLPVMDAMNAFGWSAHVPVPTVVPYHSARPTLDDALTSWPGLYQPLVFCMGIVLLFSKERGRRGGQLDWTRRWGVISSYVVFLISAASFLFLASLVLVGISAVFISMPAKNQPGVTRLFTELSTTYLRWGPEPRNSAFIVQAAFSSIAIVVACVALFEALTSIGPKRLVMFLLAPLALFALRDFLHAGLFYLNVSSWNPANAYDFGIYFRPVVLVDLFDNSPGIFWKSAPIDSLEELAKWCIVLGVAVLLSIAQLSAWWGRRKTRVAAEK